MSIFEFLSVAVSILLSLSAAQLLGSAPHVLDKSRRDWLVVSWVGALLCLHLLIWWGIWRVHSVQLWTLDRFAVLLGSPALLYVASNVLVSGSPADVPSWRNRLMEIRVSFFVVLILLTIMGLLRAVYILDVPITHPLAPATLSVLIVGAVFRRRGAQLVVALLYWVSLLWLAYERLEPATF